MASTTTNRSFRETGHTLMIINNVLVGLFLIPLLWLIPMTIAYKKSMSDDKQHIVLGICSVIFGGTPLAMIAGILLLCSGGTNAK